MKTTIDIICYGCGRGEKPKNTIETIKNCQQVNSNWIIDLDLQLTKDGEIILFHDDNTFRRTGEDFNVSDCTLDEIKQLNTGYYFKVNNSYPYRENSIKIPTLNEVLHQFITAKYIFDIHTNNPKIIDKLIAIIDAFDISENIIIVSKYDAIIKEFKQKKPNWTFGATTKEVKKMVFSSFVFLDFLFQLKSDVLLIPIKFNNITLLTNRVIHHVKKRNKKLIVWKKEGKRNDDVQCIETKKDYIFLKNKGVNAVYTNFPKRFSKRLGKSKPY